METKKKKKFLNALMVVLIAVIALCGVMAVGKLKGWFGTEEKSVLRSQKTSGVVNIERKGVGYRLKDGLELMDGDVVETKQGSQAQIALEEKNTLVLNENTEISIVRGQKDDIELALKKGEVFADIREAGKNCSLHIGDQKTAVTGNVLSASVQTGSASLSLFQGETEVAMKDGSTKRIREGERLLASVDETGETGVEIAPFEVESLNDFLIAQAQSCESREALCFGTEEFQMVLDQRAAEKQAALTASLNAERIALEKQKEKAAEEETKQEAEAREEEAPQEQTPKEEPKPQAEAKPNPQPETQAEPVPAEVKECTIEIRCETILDHMNELADGKEAYVPANGVILALSTVEIQDGDTVFDVLERVCSYGEIQLEYAWTPIYDSYYIEGINHLYEFDCGNESGWMYKVNGWFPNYGCSSYEVEDGDAIVWLYSCKGLGEDIGGSNF